MPEGGASVWFGALIGALATGLGRIIAAIPDLLGALVILLIGYGIGKLLQLVVTKLLKAAHFDRLMEREGVTPALQRANINRTPAEILGIIVYWFIFLLAIQAAAGALGLTALTDAVESIILYVPNVIAALVIVLLGGWLASFLQRLTKGSADAAGISYASILGNLVLAFVLFFTFTIAMDVLGVNLTFLITAFAILLGGLALAGAVAFGLGARQMAADVLAGRELRNILQPGDTFTTDEMSGTLTEIRPTISMVRTPKGDVAVENTELLNKHMTKQSNSQQPPKSGGASQAA